MGRICTLPPIEGDPQPEAAWRLYYRDTFDRACPPSVEVEGTGLARGLMELWARYLGEEVNGFSAFSLTLDGQNYSIQGPKAPMNRLIEWVFQGRPVANGYMQAAEFALTRRLALFHTKDRDLTPLLRLVESCDSSEAFFQALSSTP